MEMKRKERERGMMEDGVNFPLGCGEKGEKRRKSTAGRNLSELSFSFPVMAKLSFTGR